MAHYVEKQLETVADGILPIIDLSFGGIVNQQIQFFQ
jgi:hypothetical protein